MDPLSLAASVIAVIGAASATAEVIEKLCQFFNAPELILQLLNEVSDFRIVLASVQDTTLQLGELDLDNEMVQYMHRLITKSGDVLFDIRRTTEGGLIKSINDKNRARLKISWKSWLRKHNEIEKFSKSLRVCRVDIVTACTILTASSVPRVCMQLDNISLDYQNLGNALEAHSTYSRHQLEKLKMEMEFIEPSFKNLLQGLQQYSTPPQYLPTQPVVRFQKTARKACSSLCMCNCHRRSKVNSPSWMTAVMGRISIGYSGHSLLGFGTQACTEKSCNRTDSSLLTVNYKFPSWLFSRMLVLRDHYSPLHGHMISFRTPRVVPWNAQIFHLGAHGSVAAVQKLFDQGLASPYDVDELGASALSFAVQQKRPDMCRFLLLQNSDLAEQEDANYQSPNDLLLAHLLSTPEESTTVELKFAMAFDSNASETLLARGFSILHRVILKLTPIDLESRLLISTTDIESRCSQGRTPLYWAAIRGDVDAVQTLLRFGADIKAIDVHSKSVLHNALSIECLEIVLSAALAQNTDHSSEQKSTGLTEPANNDCLRNFLHQKDMYNFTPLTYAAFEKSPARLRILLAYGAATEVPGTNPALTVAVQVNAHSVIELLLQNNSKQDVVDEESQGVLHLAGSCGDLKTLKILGTHLCCIETNNTDVFGYTPLQAFDNLRPTYTTEDEETNHQCREAFLRLLSSIKFHSEDHFCWANRFVSLDSDAAERDVETSSIGSVEKEECFFDAESVVEDMPIGFQGDETLRGESKVEYYD